MAGIKWQNLTDKLSGLTFLNFELFKTEWGGVWAF